MRRGTGHPSEKVPVRRPVEAPRRKRARRLPAAAAAVAAAYKAPHVTYFRDRDSGFAAYHEIQTMGFDPLGLPGFHAPR